jgi:hypothetical protein
MGFYPDKESSRTVTEQNSTNGKDFPSSTAEVDYDVFGAREIRDVLKSKLHCLRAGFSTNHVIIKTFNDIRDHYIQRVGLATYLSQMLGPLGNVPVQYCTLYGENGGRLQFHLNGNNNQPIQRFIAQRFEWNNLPAMVEVRRNPDQDNVEVRYL